MKIKIMELLKHLKTLFDAYKIWVYAIGLLSTLGVGGYVAYESEPVAKPKPVTVEKVDELKIIHITPEYALRGHKHPDKAIKQAIDEYDEKHDPSDLNH